MLSRGHSLDSAATERLCIDGDATLGAAMSRLNETGMQILLVVESGRRLVGTLTDGDIRRAILKGKGLEDRVQDAVNVTPLVLGLTDKAQGLDRLRAAGLGAAPVVDIERRVVGLVRLEPVRESVALILAGGRGTRLGSLTARTPKPLLEVGEKPLLGHLLDSLARAGFTTAFVAVHHLADQVVRFVEANRPESIAVEYIREETPLGTAGALSELPADLAEPVLVVNGDLATKTSLRAMMEFHLEHGTAMTIGCAQYRHEIPFGVLEMSGSEVTRVVEKPTVVRFVSAGVYVLDPLVYRMAEKGRSVDMPALINTAFDAGLLAASFPIVEYWIDVGRPEQLAEARTSWNG